MKKLKYIIPYISFLFLLVACDSILNVEPKSTLTSVNMWQSEGQAKSGIAGMHDDFRDTFNYPNFLFWFEFRSGIIFPQIAGGGGLHPSWGALYNNTLDASSSPGTNWSSVYQTINLANLAIKYIPDIQFNSESEKNRLIAEAYFIRAYCYFTLARVFGDVPIHLSPFESVENENLYSTRQPVDEVFAQIKSDLEEAVALVPDNSTNDRVRPSQAAINMLIGDVYLWTAKRLNGGTEDLNRAETAVDNVLANSNYRLLENYEDIFRNEQNEEIIYSIYFSIEEQDDQFGHTFLVRIVPSQFQNNPIPVGSSPQRVVFSDNYVELANPNDSRIRINREEFISPEGQTFIWSNKYLGEVVEGTRFNVSDTPVYRFAETLLFKAEILNAKGSTSDAISYLNIVAERAYGEANHYPNTLSQNETDDAILTERLIEFGAEGKSWFDTIRLGRAFTRIPSLEGKENSHEGNILLFPISPDLITRNPNLVQTPGY